MTAGLDLATQINDVATRRAEGGRVMGLLSAEDVQQTLTALRQHHQQTEGGQCRWCMYAWPCQISLLADMIAALEAENERLRGAVAAGDALAKEVRWITTETFVYGKHEDGIDYIRLDDWFCRIERLEQALKAHRAAAPGAERRGARFRWECRCDEESPFLFGIWDGDYLEIRVRDRTYHVAGMVKARCPKCRRWRAIEDFLREEVAEAA